MNHSYPPDLSVVVITFYGANHLERCLISLDKQSDGAMFETIVVCDEIIENIPALKQRFPLVRFYQVQGRTTEEKLLAIGICQSRGKVVALTADHCTPEEHWCSQIMEEHKKPYAAIGGAIDKGSQPDTALNWAIHFYDESGYGYYLNPVARGPALNLSVCNVSYKVEALNKISEMWTNGFHVPAVNQAFLARGETLWLSPDLIVHQHRSRNIWEGLQEPFGRGFGFASMRVVRSSAGQRLFYTIFSPFLPALHLKRLISNVIRKKTRSGPVIRALPFIFLLSILWSWGEFIGYLRGPKEGIG